MPVALPTPLTRLIGREPEVQALQSTLRHDDVRLVTLTGAGGTGKTRLAIAVAAELRDAFPDGIFFVDLAPLTEPDLVLPTIASTLGVRETESKSLRAALGVFLATKRLLLVCDNFEHLLAAATVVSDLLKAAPGGQGVGHEPGIVGAPWRAGGGCCPACGARGTAAHPDC